MLVLTRKAKQQVQIGPHITVTILQVKGKTVRVGIEAPADVCVLRTEVAAKMPLDSTDPTVHAARKKIQRENEISSTAKNEGKSGRATVSANGSLRCRAPRVDATPVISPIQSTGPASFFPIRRRRFAVR